MTHEEAQKELDSRLIPFSRFGKAKKANGELTDGEKEELIQLVIDYKSNIKSMSMQQVIEKIAVIIKAYWVRAEKTGINVKGAGNAVANQIEYPFIIRQVLFYFTVEYIWSGNGTQKDIIEGLKTYGIKVSHNFFSRTGYTPNEYCEYMCYKQPQMVADYKGQKKGELAEAIKGLVYQAGRFNAFADIFGGSGAASVAFPKRRSSRYMYNDIDIMTYNLFRVISNNKLYWKCYKCLEKLINAVEGYGVLFGDVDFEKEIQDYFNNKRTDNSDEKNIVRRDIPKNDDEKLQRRFYQYYAYFYNLTNKDDKVRQEELQSDEMKIRYAVAEIVFQSLTTNGTIGVSEILRMMYSSEGKKRRGTKPYKFLEKNFEILVKDMHKEIKRIQCYNKGFDTFIDECMKMERKEKKKENILFYSDSPYLETSRYRGKEDFTFAEMKLLIDKLVESKQKFIFSCRATGLTARGNEDNKKNEYIARHVFGVFLDYWEYGKKKFWVLVPNRGTSLVDMLTGKRVTEVMLTNYEILDFDGFKAYTFQDLLEVMLVYGRVDDKDERLKNWTGMIERLREKWQ